MFNFQDNGAKYIHTEPSVLARFRYSSLESMTIYFIGDQCSRNTSYFVHINVEMLVCLLCN